MAWRVPMRTAALLPGPCQRALLRIPDLHGAVPRPADDVLAVWRVRHRLHRAQVPRHRALIIDLKTICIACTDAVSFKGVTNCSDLHTGNKDMRNR